MVVSVLDSPGVFDGVSLVLLVEHATTILVWVFVIMLRNEKLECTTLHQFSLFDVNVICVMAGLRYVPIRRQGVEIISNIEH